MCKSCIGDNSNIRPNIMSNIISNFPAPPPASHLSTLKYYHKIDEKRNEFIKNSCEVIFDEGVDSLLKNTILEGKSFMIGNNTLHNLTLQTKIKFNKQDIPKRTEEETEKMIYFYDNIYCDNSICEKEEDEKIFFNYPEKSFFEGAYWNFQAVINKKMIEPHKGFGQVDNQIFKWDSVIDNKLYKIDNQSFCDCDCCGTKTPLRCLRYWGSRGRSLMDNQLLDKECPDLVCLNCVLKYGVDYLTNHFQKPLHNGRKDCSFKCSNENCDCLCSVYDEHLRELFNFGTDKTEDLIEIDKEDIECYDLYCKTCLNVFENHLENEELECCEECGKRTLKENEDLKLAPNDCFYCDKCYSDRYFYCNNCNRDCEMESEFFTEDTNERMCSECIIDECSYCDYCECYYETTPTYCEENGERICRDCLLERPEIVLEEEYREDDPRQPPINRCEYCREEINMVCLNPVCIRKRKEKVKTIIEVSLNNEMSKFKRIKVDNCECPICYDNLCDTQRRCGHNFCYNCIKLSSIRSFACPMCRNTDYF